MNQLINHSINFFMVFFLVLSSREYLFSSRQAEKCPKNWLWLKLDVASSGKASNATARPCGSWEDLIYSRETFRGLVQNVHISAQPNAHTCRQICKKIKNKKNPLKCTHVQFPVKVRCTHTTSILT